MARPRTYDRDAVLDRALTAFEVKGYEAVSLQDIVDVTGLSRSSLYAEFESKHGLYLAALDRYRAQGVAELDALFAQAPTALGGIAAYLDVVAAGASTGAEPPAAGCFMTNAAVEVAARDAETASRARVALDGLIDAFTRQVARAQREGDVPAAHTPERVLDLVTTVYGLRAMSKSGLPRDVAAQVAKAALGRLQR